MKDYQVIITLGGTGKRFADAGYELPKYMLPADINNPEYKVIDLVSDMYKGMKKLYLCNENHIDKYNLKSILDDGLSIIVPVKPGKGPGDAILQAEDYISRDNHIFVQYCDTFQPWNIYDIKEIVENNLLDSAVVVTDENCPSVFDGTLYGRVKVVDNKVIDIMEKAPTEYSRYLGCGTFYFKDGETLLNYINIQDKNRDKYYLNGESYINCTIKAMLDDNATVMAINVNNYLNLGVPCDYEDYIYWQKTINNLNVTHNTIENSTLIMPAAGLGSRFKETYKEPKPLIPMLSGRKMYQDAIKYSFPSSKVTIVTRKDLDFYEDFKIDAAFHNFIGLQHITEGQALTIEAGLGVEDTGPIIINSCDQGILYDETKFNKIYNDADIVICGLKNYTSAINKPNSFSWINSNGTDVIEITSKRCAGNPKDSYVFISCLIYKNKNILERSIKSLINRNGKTNGEYYIDESINDSIKLGYKVKMLNINSYINWGTPEELYIFNWWNNFFNKISHEYLA